MKTYALIAALTLSCAVPAAAATVFTEDFSGYGSTTQLNAADSVFGGVWATTDGTVDYLTAGGAFGALCPTPGSNCVDLDGSTGNAGVFSTVQVFGEGVYNLFFQIMGNRRGAGDEEVTISFGNVAHTFTLGDTQAVAQDYFGSIFQNIVVGAGGSQLSFSNAGGDNIGAILKTVSIDTVPSPVPLPATGGLMIAGLAGLAALRRRKARA